MIFSAFEAWKAWVGGWESATIEGERRVTLMGWFPEVWNWY